MQHHSAVQRLELIDLGNTGLPDLVVESNSGGGGTSGSTLQIFSLADGKFDEVLRTEARMEDGIDERYAQELDVAGTRVERGRRFRTIKTTYLEKGNWFRKPRVTIEFYERGSGVDRQSGGYSQQKPAPLK